MAAALSSSGSSFSPPPFGQLFADELAVFGQVFCDSGGELSSARGVAGAGVTPEIPTPGRWMFRHPGEVIHGGKAKEFPG
ncbi:hypothetical protein AB0I51_16610, partial [Streptomyces sp. NPDC050549]|uniref:hypothetical protein n=1 Tax=Streptomyces sp. NPDC050549 TaxID=3155406 RepID=UPI00343616E4